MEKRLEYGREYIAVADDSINGWSPVKRIDFDATDEQRAPAWVGSLADNGNLVGTPQQEIMFAMPVTGMHMIANPAYIDDEKWNEQRRAITRFYRTRIPTQYKHLVSSITEGGVDGMKTALLGVARNDPKKQETRQGSTHENRYEKQYHAKAQQLQQLHPLLAAADEG